MANDAGYESKPHGHAWTTNTIRRLHAEGHAASDIHGKPHRYVDPDPVAIAYKRR